MERLQASLTIHWQVASTAAIKNPKIFRPFGDEPGHMASHQPGCKFFWPYQPNHED